MRVLLIHNRPPTTVGGYERILKDVWAALERAGHEVTLLVPRGFDAGGRRRAIERAARTVLGETGAHDAVCFFGMGFLPLGLIDWVDAPAVGVVADGWMVYGPEVTQTSADLSGVRWLFISEAVRERAPVDGAVVHPGVDPAEFPFSVPGPWGWRLAYVGRVEPRKGVATAVAALAELPEATLTVDGPVEDATGLEHPRVRFAHTEANRAYAAADAVVFPVEWPEPWGLVPLEAMSVGRPVVATGTGGSGEYLRDGENALLFPPGDAGALAAALRRIAADAELRATLIAGGRETAARFTAAAFADRVVEEILARVRGR